jgi:hypothetical protein
MDATLDLSRNSNPHACFRRARLADALTGVGCGLYLTAWLHQALGLGSSPISLTALQVVLLAALALACWLVRRSDQMTRLPWQSVDRRSDDTAAWSFAVIHLALLTLAVFPSLIIAPAWFVAETLTTEAALASPTQQWLIALASLGAGWLLPLTLAFMLLAARVSSAARGPAPIASRLTAVSLGIVFSVFVPGLLGGAVVTALAGALLCCVAIGLAAFIYLSAMRNDDPDSQNAMSEQFVAPPTSTSSPRNTIVTATSGVVVALTCGMLFASLRRVLDQLFLDTAWLSSVEWAAVLAGCAGGLWLGRRASGVAASRIASWTTLLVVGWSVLLLVAFPMWIRLTLELKSTVSIALVAMSLKAIVAACVVAPLGCCIGLHAAAIHKDDWQWQLPTVFCGGAWIANWLMLPGAGVATAVAVAASLLTIVGLAEYLALAPMRRRIVMATATGLLLAVGCLSARRAYDPALSARLLFDTRVFTIGRASMRFDLLPYLNEDRCLQVVESRNRTLTLWKTNGSQIHIRESGIPVGIVGCEPAIGPQLSAESLQAILPLTLHEHPSRLLLTGLGSGAVLHTSLQFPLTTIYCVDPDPWLVDTVSRHVLSQLMPNPLDDERVRIDCCEPLVALRAMPGEFDVILCTSANSVLMNASAGSTVEFLKTASASLAADGIYAQPLDIVDVGPQAVRTIIQTWQSAFEYVGAIEIAPGRLLLTATNSPRGVFREGFVNRLQYPHVRHALAQTGWDWATPLQLTTWHPADLEELYAGQGPAVSRVSNMTLTCWLPWEVTRWGDKYVKVRETLSTHATVLQTLAGLDGQSPEVADRLQELDEQRKLINDKPDQHWSYRAVTKRMLVDSPRAKLVQVKGEEPVHRRHPEDKQRLRYFKLLAAAMKHVTVESLEAVADLDSPYDPLVTFFLHQEIAELAARDRESLSGIELRHRLYRARYTTPGDHSVRNVVAAIELLCDHVAPETDPAWRGDQLDALLQTLQERWGNRGEIKPNSSRVVLVDIEKSIAAMERAFEVMPTLAAARGQTEHDWSARQTVLEKLLVRPLRTYRTLLLPHHLREERMRDRQPTG